MNVGGMFEGRYDYYFTRARHSYSNNEQSRHPSTATPYRALGRVICRRDSLAIGYIDPLDDFVHITLNTVPFNQQFNKPRSPKM